MRIMAADTGVTAFYMIEFGIVKLAFIFISAFDFCTVEGGSSSEIVDIAETKGNIFALIVFDRGYNSIWIFRLEARDLGIDRCL